MQPKKLYREGDWFLVPLENLPGRFGLGLLARMGSRGHLFGFFFGPPLTEAPVQEAREKLRPADAVLAKRFSDLGLLEEGWPILGRLSNWDADRAAWSLPEFAHLDILDPSIAFGRAYDPEDPSSQFRERRIAPEEAQWMPRDGFAGHVFLQQILTDLLTKERPLPTPGGGALPTIWPTEA